MPIYEYSCSACGKLNDVLQKVNDPPPQQCESCGAQGTLSRVVSRTSFVLKGGGWYSDLYSSSKKGGETPSASPPSSGGAAAPAPASSSTSTSTSAPAPAAAPASTSGSSGGDKK